MFSANKKYRKVKDENCVLVFEVFLDGKELSEAEGNALIRVQGSVSLPGFRTGKVPPAMIREKYPSLIKDEAVDMAARNGLNAILTGEGIYPVVAPKISDLAYEPGKKISFKITLEVNPKFEPHKYEKIKVTKKIKKVTDEDVDNYIKNVQDYNAYLKSADDTAVIEEKHYVVADYEMTNASQEASAPVKSELIDMSSPQNIAGMNEALKGAKKGDIKEFETEFDGNKTKFKVTVNDIKEKVSPALDDNFLAALGVKTVEELKSNVRKILENESLQNTERDVIKQIEDALIKENKFPLPPTVVEEEMKELFEIFKKRANLPEEQKLQMNDYASTLRPIAERNLTVTYLLHNIARKENIKATEEDFNKEMDKVMSTLKSDDEKKKAKEMFEHRKDYILASIAESKTFDFIKSKAEIKEDGI